MLYKSVIENQVNICEVFFPSSIMIKLTNNCNFRCGFCSQGNAKNINIDIEIVKRVLDEAKMYGVSEIVFSGGEPLLYPDFMEAISYGKQLGLNQTLVTNGYLLDNYIPDIVDKVNQIGISLHGDEKAHDSAVGFSGAYHKVVKNIETITRYKKAPFLTLNFTITENNYSKIQHVIEFAKMYNCRLSVARLNQIGKSVRNNKIKSTIDAFFRDIINENEIIVSNVIPRCQMQADKKHLCHSCSAGIASVCIDADQTVKICGSATCSFGSLEEHSLYDIWNNDEFKRFRSLEWLPSICRNCREFAICLGGCKAENYENKYSTSKDCLLSSAIEEFYHKCKYKKLTLLFSNIRKINDRYLLLGKPNRIVDEDGMLLLRAILKEQTVEMTIGHMSLSKRKQALELLYGMYKDCLIDFV